jgi:hypothetical protein
MAEQWIEVNLNVAHQQLAALPLDVVDPLVHQVLAGTWQAWFYSRYVDAQVAQLRLRILWRDDAAADAQDKLTTFLDTTRADGVIDQWFVGSHGEPDQTYPGEADDYGPEIWPLTYRNWMSGCEMVLVILKHQADGTLTKPLEYHWSRRLHMFSNPLGLSYQQEAGLCVQQARGYGWRG